MLSSPSADFKPPFASYWPRSSGSVPVPPSNSLSSVEWRWSELWLAVSWWHGAWSDGTTLWCGPVQRASRLSVCMGVAITHPLATAGRGGVGHEGVCVCA